MSRSAEYLDQGARQELLRAYLLAQRKYEDEGRIPLDRGTILTRYRRFWEALGAIHLGLLIAIMTIVLNFIIVNMLLHLAPS